MTDLTEVSGDDLYTEVRKRSQIRKDEYARQRQAEVKNWNHKRYVEHRSEFAKTLRMHNMVDLPDDQITKEFMSDMAYAGRDYLEELL